jgi:AcrR family transcriptional regulator
MAPILNPAPTSQSARRILDAAVEICAASGEASLRIADVMELAGVQAPMIYRHFGDREGLVQSAQLARGLSVMNTVLVAFADAIASATDAESVRRCVSMLVQGIGSSEQLEMRRGHLEVLGAAISRPVLLERLQENRSSVSELLLAALSRVQADGYIRSDLDVVVFVDWAMGASMGLAGVELLSSVPKIREGWLQMQLQCINAMLFGDEIGPWSQPLS